MTWWIVGASKACTREGVVCVANWTCVDLAGRPSELLGLCNVRVDRLYESDHGLLGLGLQGPNPKP